MRTLVLDSLREGVIATDIYDPTLNPLYRDVLQHYGVVALPCRVRDPDRNGLWVRVLNRNADAHCGSGALTARKIKSRTDGGRPVAHSAKAPVGILRLLDSLGRDSATVVANQRLKEAGQILNLNLDSPCFGMP